MPRDSSPERRGIFLYGVLPAVLAHAQGVSGGCVLDHPSGRPPWLSYKIVRGLLIGLVPIELTGRNRKVLMTATLALDGSTGWALILAGAFSILVLSLGKFKSWPLPFRFPT
jgi:hypothetical protein